MTDDDQPVIEDAVSEESPPDGVGGPGARSAAARAASRARRMGGAVGPAPTGSSRPSPGPRPDAEPEAGGVAPSVRSRVAGARRPSPRPRAESGARTKPTRKFTAGADEVVARKSSPASASTKPGGTGAARRRWIPAGIAAALVAALAIVDVLLLQDWRDQPGKAERREKLVATVNVAVARILSYDYRHLDADAAAAQSYLTGTFKDQYVASMNATIKPGAPTAKAVVIGEVGSSALTSVSGDGKQAVLLVLGQQTVTNSSQKTPRYDMVSLRVTAQLVHGRWRVSDLATL